jgi:hypothetical protein
MESRVERGDADDPAAVAQRAASVLDEEERSSGRGGHELVVAFLGHLVDHLRQGARRVDDHDVQPAEPRFGLRRQPPQVIEAALVGPQGIRPAARAGDLGDDALRGDLVREVAEQHRGAVRRQPLHDRPAYPP